MADKPKPKKRKKSGRRRRFGTPAKLKEISAAQKRTRKKRKRLEREGGDVIEDLPIIENITKSEQAWFNELRRVRRPEDLDDFE